eukprot:TRINITY_DN3919_c0_g1_i1.p1 TRINITY_DN3919_c0_g1~~TRINITY_DN3919_c0_g1_i1.p1  ORF type:complete len:225 (-),score=43.37 TRINITY_DN3919_c0_g1_i1:92-766(-)
MPFQGEVTGGPVFDRAGPEVQTGDMRTFDEMTPVLRKLSRAMAKYAVIDRKPYDFGTGMDLYPAEIHMLTTVDMLGGAGVTELAREFGVTKGAVSQQVAKLVDKGLLAKQSDPENKARVVVTVTSVGRKASLNHLEFHKRHDKAFLDYLSRLDRESYEAVSEMAEEMDRWMDRYLQANFFGQTVQQLNARRKSCSSSNRKILSGQCRTCLRPSCRPRRWKRSWS